MGWTVVRVEIGPGCGRVVARTALAATRRRRWRRTDIPGSRFDLDKVALGSTGGERAGIEFAFLTHTTCPTPILETRAR
jgi:hypothetical protein